MICTETPLERARSGTTTTWSAKIALKMKQKSTGQLPNVAKYVMFRFHAVVTPVILVLGAVSTSLAFYKFKMNDIDVLGG